MIFSKEQISCLEAPEQKVLVRASAGTGKTTVLIEAARRSLLKSNSVVLITFTRDAAEQIERKLHYRANFVGTIHAFALREINKIAEKYIFKSKIMKEKEIKSLLVQTLMTVDNGIKPGYKGEITKILHFMNNRTIDAMDNPNRYYKIMKEYDKLKRKYEKYDHNDSPEYLLELMQRFKWKLDYDHLFVDEIQDIGIHEYNLINKFNGRIFLIGDPRQSIYLFRNSVPNVFDNFSEIGYNIYILEENYRSFQEILDFADSGLKAMRGCGGLLTNDKLLLMNNKTQILCRTNREVEILSNYFSNVSTVHAFKGLEADDVLVIDFTAESVEASNIMFVAKTRARNRLGLCSLKEAVLIGRRIKNGY